MLYSLLIFGYLTTFVTCKLNSALIIIDVQDCFLPGGNLPVADGVKIVPVINEIRRVHEGLFSLVVLSQDWHCPDHVSFVSEHPGSSLYDVVNLTYNSNDRLCYGRYVPDNYTHARHCNTIEHVVSQTLWPVHCVQNVTTGPTSSQFYKLLTQRNTDVIIKKGFNCEIDSYSVFFDNGGFSQTELNAILKLADINRVFIVGLALDYCVYYTAKDAKRLGYDTFLVRDATRGVNNASSKNAITHMKHLGIHVIQAEDIGGIVVKSNAATHSISTIIFISILSLCMSI